MPEEKKSFIVYTNIREYLEMLSMEQRGQLFTAMLDFEIGKDVKIEDNLVKMAFLPIKNAMIENKAKWKEQKEKRSNGGLIGNLKRWHFDLYQKYQNNEISLKEAENIAKHRKASDTDKSDSACVANNGTLLKEQPKESKPKKAKFNFRKEFLNLGVEEQYIDDWLKVRKERKASNTQTAFKSLLSKFQKSDLSVNECVKICAERGWKGFDVSWLDNLNNFNQGNSNDSKHFVEGQRFKSQLKNDNFPDF